MTVARCEFCLNAPVPCHRCSDAAFEAMATTVPGTARARREKLVTHDKHAEDALEALGDWMTQEPELIIAAARGRHAEGSIRYGDRLMYEFDDATLRAEALQELADAVNYFVVLLSREKQP